MCSKRGLRAVGGSGAVDPALEAAWEECASRQLSPQLDKCSWCRYPGLCGVLQLFVVFFVGSDTSVIQRGRISVSGEFLEPRRNSLKPPRNAIAIRATGHATARVGLRWRNKFQSVQGKVSDKPKWTHKVGLKKLECGPCKIFLLKP